MKGSIGSPTRIVTSERWKGWYDKRRLSSRENWSTAPRKRRKLEYSRELIHIVREIRQANPTYSAKKIWPFRSTMSSVPSVPTLGRLIHREKLFFRSDTNQHTKYSKSDQKAHEWHRKPYNLKVDGARQLNRHFSKPHKRRLRL